MDRAQTLYHFLNYKDYVRFRIDNAQHGHRGRKKEIAERIGTESTFVSQVLNGKLHFSLEQAHVLNGYFSHAEEESLYFLKLVQLERSGTPALRTLLEKELRRRSDAALRETGTSAGIDSAQLLEVGVEIK